MIRYIYCGKEKTILSITDLEQLFQAVFRIRIRIHRIHVFLGLPDPLVRDPDPDPSIIKQI
jgi:hypothetical protein